MGKGTEIFVILFFPKVLKDPKCKTEGPAWWNEKLVFRFELEFEI